MTIALAIAAAVAAAAPADPGQLSSYDPASIVAFLQKEGYRAKLEKDGEGDPVIRSGAAGTDFSIFFYGCEKHEKCDELQFSSGFDFDSGKEPGLEKINAWNSKYRYARAYADDEKDPMLDMDMTFPEGRMPEKMFRAYLEMWTDQLGDFKEHIDW